jgi:excisionase family DNA binding protein
MVEKKVLISEVTADELANMVADKLIVKMEKYIQDYLDHRQDFLLARKEAADFLSIDISTLYLWVKKGKINSYGIGNRRYFKKQEIIDALIKLR